MKCLFLHGLGQNQLSWSSVIELMDSDLEIECLDLFGMCKNSGEYSYLYKVLNEYCENIDEPFILIGLSLGGVLALNYMIENRNKVKGAVLIGARASMPKLVLKLQNLFFRLLPTSFFSKKKMNKKLIIDLCDSMCELNFSSSLRDINCPVLVVCGEKDKYNLASAYELHNGIANSELIIISGAGHEVNEDKPVELSEVIREFVFKNKI